MNKGTGGIGCGTIIFLIIIALLLFSGDGNKSSSRSNYSSPSYSNYDNYISDEELQDFVNSYDYDDFR